MNKKEGALLETENSRQKELYTINDVALMLKVHQQTLRNWERKKVVVPLRAGTRRVYTRQHIELCLKIKEFSGKGVPLKGIKELMENIK